MGLNRGKGFTLVELVTVVAVVAVLGAIVLQLTGDKWRLSTESRLRAIINLRRSAVDRFRADTGLWPLTSDDVIVTTAPSRGLDDAGNQAPLPAGSWQGPYLDNRLYSPQIIHPRYRSLSLKYKTTAPGVGQQQWNTSLTALDGSNIGAW